MRGDMTEAQVNALSLFLVSCTTALSTDNTSIFSFFSSSVIAALIVSLSYIQ